MLLLLERGADVGVINGEGQTPRDMAEKGDICKLLLAAEQTDTRRREERLLAAAREGDLETICQMVGVCYSAFPVVHVRCVSAEGGPPTQHKLCGQPGQLVSALRSIQRTQGGGSAAAAEWN